MVDQADVNRLQADLEGLRIMLATDRPAVRGRLADLVDRTEQMRRDAAGGPFEHAVASVHDLLTVLQRSVGVQSDMNDAYTHWCQRQAA
jgi:hypothetical protein